MAETLTQSMAEALKKVNDLASRLGDSKAKLETAETALEALQPRLKTAAETAPQRLKDLKDKLTLATSKVDERLGSTHALLVSNATALRGAHEGNKAQLDAAFADAADRLGQLSQVRENLKEKEADIASRLKAADDRIERLFKGLDKTINALNRYLVEEFNPELTRDSKDVSEGTDAYNRQAKQMVEALDGLATAFEPVLGGVPDAYVKLHTDAMSAAQKLITSEVETLSQAAQGVGQPLKAEHFKLSDLAFDTVRDVLKSRQDEMDKAIADFVPAAPAAVEAVGRLPEVPNNLKKDFQRRNLMPR